MNYRPLLLALLLGVGISVLFSCANPVDDNRLDYPAIIPKPVRLVPSGKVFLITSSTSLIADKALAPLATYFREALEAPFNQLPVTASPHIPLTSGAIHFFLVDDETLGKEGYRLDIAADHVQLSANTPNGIFWGIQTLKQIVASSPSGLMLATATIHDTPRFSWRGTMLDVSRHFFTVNEVKRYIDLIAAYKINVLHLHLTDDQGWRLEIKSWPKLTSIGGSTQVGGGAGGFYSQEDYREIVRHAESRFITVVPEIDFPGHVNAALAAYGELNCDGKPRPVYTGVEVGFSYLCPNETSRKFIDDVLSEVAELTPGPYIHIGGDEVTLLSQEDYINFINHIRQTIRANGKRMIGWEEIGQAKLDNSDISQHWHSTDRTQSALDKKAKIILSPSTIAYLDMKYHPDSPIGHDWAAFIEVDDTYEWNPENYIEDLPTDQLMGIESPLWTETVTTFDDLEYLVFPRMLSLAEVAWTPQEQRHWNDFRIRLAAHGPRLNQLKINYYPSTQIPWHLF